MTPTLSIIIASYNTSALLEQTLRSLPDKPTHEVIVVDNASTDGSPEMVAAKFPEVKLIRNQHNVGFARANNEGIKVAHGKYLLLLNSDTEVGSDTLTVLVTYLNAHPGVGAITPKVVLPDGAIDLACHRGLPTPWNAFTYFTKLEQLFPSVKLFSGYHQAYKNFDTIHPIDATAATALIIRKSIVDQIGLLDERFFLYGEDLDYCQRMSDAGWHIIYHPGATILHHKSASGKKNLARGDVRQASINHFYATMKQFYEKHYQDKYPKWLRHLVYVGIDLKQKLHR